MSAAALLGDGVIRSIAELDAVYSAKPVPASLVKESARVTPEYRALIEASPFVVLATCGPEGLDASPRGDRPGFVRIHDATTLMLPDRAGNNRCDSLRNIIRDSRVALLFLIPGSGTTLRANGTAVLSIDPALCRSFAVDGKSPRSVMVMTIETMYFQCARAIVRSELWNPERHADETRLPTPGQILASMTSNAVGGPAYDKEWPERARKTLW